MKNPAEAPRDPVGETYTATGTGEDKMCWMMSCMEVFEAAGRIHGDQHQAGMLARGLLDAVVDVFGHDRLDFVADAQFDHARGRVRGWRGAGLRLRGSQGDGQ